MIYIVHDWKDEVSFELDICFQYRHSQFWTFCIALQLWSILALNFFIHNIGSLVDIFTVHRMVLVGSEKCFLLDKEKSLTTIWNKWVLLIYQCYCEGIWVWYYLLSWDTFSLQLRFSGDLLMELGAGVELATAAMPNLFLPLACAANVAKVRLLLQTTLLLEFSLWIGLVVLVIYHMFLAHVLGSLCMQHQIYSLHYSVL